MKENEFREMLHPRVIDSCEKLFDDEHYKDACLRAFESLAGAIKERTGSKHALWKKTGRKDFGRNLTRYLQEAGSCVKLRIPFGVEMQDNAALFFAGAMAYYRNYAAHEGEFIDRKACLRGMIVASELLEMFGASELSFHDIGGVDGLVEHAGFASLSQMAELLQFLDDRAIIKGDYNAFFEDLEMAGFSERQMKALIDVGLVEYTTEDRYYYEDLVSSDGCWDEWGQFSITNLGRDELNKYGG